MASSSNLHYTPLLFQWHDVPVDIRDRIAQVLEEHPEWSIRSVSLRAGLSDSMLGKFMKPDAPGGVKSMTLDKFEAIAEALEVNPRWLIFGDSPRELDSKIAYIWDHIPAPRREQAERVLQTFMDEEQSA